MEKMKTKDEIMDSVFSRKDISNETVELRVQLCRLGVEIDIRDLLRFFLKDDIEMHQEVEKGLRELKKVPVSRKE